ncbi:hypothetical protein MAA8898_01440 [Maliponia aquimaris]|uniref:Uncharacterized protein n=1 Tax=Maliponia aquimaris TaxID=1673631 RepID=A0A238K5P5_9RHOB|nr:hypothetical protein MAA8898_01440 [Maliponia aquimaris]
MWGQEFPNLTGGTAVTGVIHHLSKPVLIGQIRAHGQFGIISSTDPVPGDAWADFLPESAVLESNWKDLQCGMYNTQTATCVLIKSNGGVRRVNAESLVRIQLSDPDLAHRAAGVNAIARGLDPSQIDPLAESIADEPDAALKRRKDRLQNCLAARFGALERGRVIHNAAKAETPRGVLRRKVSV